VVPTSGKQPAFLASVLDRPIGAALEPLVGLHEVVQVQQIELTVSHGAAGKEGLKNLKTNTDNVFCLLYIWLTASSAVKMIPLISYGGIETNLTLEKQSSLLYVSAQ